MVANPRSGMSTTSMASATATSPRLGDWLLAEGYVSPAQLDLALREQQRAGRLLGETLVELGVVSQEVLARFLAHKTQTEATDLRGRQVPADVLALVPEDLARRLVALPLSRDGEELTVAIADPLNVTAFDLLERTTGLRIRLVAAPEGEVLDAIGRLHGTVQPLAQIVDEWLRQGPDQPAPPTENDAPTVRLAQRILEDAVAQGASDIHLHPEEKYLRVRVRRDGRLDAGYLLPKSIQAALLARFKILAGMDIAENRRAQDGRGSVTVGGREIGLRLSSLPTTYGESLVIRILDRARLGQGLGELGFDADLQRRFEALLQLPHGVILVTGPTGSGKTTSLYAALGLMDGSERSIFTLEDPVEYPLPLVRQTQINEAAGLSFAEGLRTLLRQDPDVILVGETQDVETAQLMIRAALTGHLVFSTLHTNDALGAVARLLDLGIAPYLLAPTLRGVLAQRLVRRLCPECAEPEPDADALFARFQLVPPSGSEVRPSRPRGCAACLGTGYRGRVGVYELCVVDAALQTAIAAGGDSLRLEAIAKAAGFRTLLEDGVRKALRGVTTLEEVFRVTGR